MLGQRPVCHGEGKLTILHLVTGDRYQHKRILLVASFCSTFGKIAYGDLQCILAWSRMTPSFLKSSLLPSYCWWLKSCTTWDVSQNYQMVLRYNPGKPYINLNCNGAQYRDLHPCIQQWSARCPFHLLCYLKWYIYSIYPFVCMILYASTGSFYQISEASSTQRSPEIPHLGWTNQLLGQVPLNAPSLSFETAYVREKMWPFSWVARRCAVIWEW